MKLKSKNQSKGTNTPLWARTGHQKPVTRRDFLAGTVGAFSATLTMPPLLSLLLKDKAFADEVSCPAGIDLIPFITINLSGGAAMSGNFVPHTSKGERLKNYNLLGLGNNGSNLPIIKGFSNSAPFAGSSTNKISKIWDGIEGSSTSAIRDKTTFVGIPCQSKDDSNENKFDVSGLLSKAGLAGALLPNLGTLQTPTGINCQAAGLTPPAPLVANSFDTLAGSLGYGGQLASLPTKTKLSLAKMIHRLNGEQARKLAQYSGGKNAKAIIDCAGAKNLEVTSANSDDINPKKNAQVSTLWGINDNTPNNDTNFVFCSMVYNSLNGNAGPVGLHLGGYDYHDGTRTFGDNQDRKVGVLIGRILSTANLLNKPVFIYVVSDGCVTSDGNETNSPWSSDRGAAGCAYMIAFHPTKAPEASGFQIGGFTQAQVADTSFITGADPQNAAFAAFANYLQINKRIDLFEKILPRTFTTDQLNSLLILSS